MDIFRRESKPVLQRSVPPSFFFYLFPRFFCDPNLIPPLYLLPHSQVSAFPLALHLCFTPFMPHFICFCLISSSTDTVALIATPPRRGLALMDKGYEYHWGKKSARLVLSLSVGAVQNLFHRTLLRDDKQKYEWRRESWESRECKGRRDEASVIVCVCVCMCMYVCMHAGQEWRRGEGGTEIERKKGGRVYAWSEGRRHFFSVFLFTLLEKKNPFLKEMIPLLSQKPPC